MAFSRYHKAAPYSRTIYYLAGPWHALPAMPVALNQQSHSLLAMNCPFCAEEIKKEAVVCRFCQQNLLFYKPFESRIDALEKKTEQLTELLVTLKDTTNNSTTSSGNIASNSKESPKIPWRKVGISIAIPVLTILVSAFIFRASGFQGNKFLFLVLAIFSSVPTGIWIGVTWPRSHFFFYFTIGLIIGVLGAAAVRVILENLPLDLSCYFVLSPSLMFLTSALFGDVIERIIYPNRKQAGFADQLAKTIYLEGLKSDPNRSTSILSSERVKNLAAAISALAPILAFMGTLVTAVVTYLKSKN